MRIWDVLSKMSSASVTLSQQTVYGVCTILRTMQSQDTLPINERKRKENEGEKDLYSTS